MSKSALDGLKVVEFGMMIAGPYCAKMLGDLGADVVKVEPPNGDSARKIGPFPSDEAHPERSALYLYLNTSKRGVTLNLSNSGDMKQFKKLLLWADVLIDNHHPNVLDACGLEWDTIHALNPRLVYTCITPYGRTGPRADVPGDELTLTQSSGFGNLLPTRSVDISRAPIKPGGNAAGYHGGLAAATATLAAVFARDKNGVGSLVDVSMEEALLSMIGPQAAASFNHKTTWCRVPDRPPAMGRMQTSDGYIILNALDDHHFASVREMMGNPDWCADDKWLNMAYRANNLMDIAPQIDEWMLKQKKEEIHHQAAQKKIPIGSMKTAEEVMAYPQYEARNYFTEVKHPEGGTHRYAGWPYQLPASPPQVHRRAPLLGEHNEEVFNEINSAEAVPTGSSPSSNPTLPLAGVRVLEFTWVWAGPYCGMLLGMLGAEVIKVEGHKRVDLMRRTIVWPLPDEKPTQLGLNDSVPFNSANMNKKSAAIDLSTPEGLELAKKLAAESDVVVDNMRPGALAKLGLDYESLCELRPNIIGASSSGRGTVGPESQYLGFATIHHALGGNSYITGYPDDHPCHTTGDVDIMNATTLAFSIMAALQHRNRTGEGQFIDYSQTAAVSSLIGEVLLGYEMTKRNPERQGNLHPTYAPHNVYKAWGIDRWLAIEVHDDQQFKSLAEAMSQPELASDARFADAASRKKNETELDEIITAWSSQRDRDKTVAKLVKAGVIAAPSRDARDLYSDQHLRERGHFAHIDHPNLGEIDLFGPPWKMNGLDAETVRAPFLGEHTDEVLKNVAGLGDSDLNSLRDKKIIQ
jgi:crotonobetainyl-CoA:carnitine CoA-transferase CaiB-like acyl-CoA transferase